MGVYFPHVNHSRFQLLLFVSFLYEVLHVIFPHTHFRLSFQIIDPFFHVCNPILRYIWTEFLVFWFMDVEDECFTSHKGLYVR